jgi:serine/threonine protein kinase
MKPERWRQVDQLFHAALERAPGERAAFLREACIDDDSLLREVESLLAQDAEIGSFIADPAYAVAASRIVVDETPSLEGQSISHYRIISLLGKGGMGEVYRARDTRLDREVAVKVLPVEFSRDPDRLRRFEQEALATSALNHPNILTIYDIGSHEGAPYIIAELLEGEELRAVLKRGAIPLSRAMDYAQQIATGLAAAHSRGIIHRDLKPENFFVTTDSFVKVLDFGLAKLRPPEAPDSKALTQRKATAPGAVMGTPSYMSPEQARGQEVDARTDIFSLGVVLYEMLAGRAPFGGVNALDVIGAILNQEPVPLRQRAPGTPRELENIVSRALRKDREERYQHVRDLLVELKDLKQELEFEAKLKGAQAFVTPLLGKSVQTSGTPPEGGTTNVQPAEASTSGQTRIRVLCVDDHPLLREGIAAIINNQPDMLLAAEASNGREAIQKYREHQPDVTLMDLRLPDMSGIDSMIAIRSEFTEARIIMLTTFEGDVEIQRSLEAGARGYLHKSIPPKDLAEAIRQVHGGKKRVPPELATQLAEHLGDEALTEREIDVLRHIAGGNRNRDIAEQLFISEETVKVHIKHIMEKLGANDRTQAVAIAVRRGIIQL